MTSASKETSTPGPTTLRPNQDYSILEGFYWPALYMPKQANDGPDCKLLTPFRHTLSGPQRPDRSQVSASTDVMTNGLEHTRICHSNGQVTQTLRDKSNTRKPSTQARMNSDPNKL